MAYEDTVDHLSKSEREVTELIFALAGYLVHDLHETVPFVLLDWTMYDIAWPFSVYCGVPNR